MLSWILQGVFIAVCAFAGVYLALWLFARQRRDEATAESGAASTSAWSEPPALAATSVFAQEAAQVQAVPLPPPGAVTPLTAPERTPAPAATPGPAAGTRPAVSQPRVRHAFEFQDDQVTVLLEMPASLLQDDAALADAWVDVIGWARSEQAHPGSSAVASGSLRPLGARASAASLTPPSSVDADQAQLQVRLDEGLRRLQAAAIRSRQMRQMLEQSMPADEAPR